MKRIVTAIAVILLTACASVDKEVNRSQEEIYRDARGQLDSGNFKSAIKLYESLQARYPYGVYADQAALDSAYAQFRMNERVQAVAECDRFIQMHPTHPRVDYAYYIKGRAQEPSLEGLLSDVLAQDVSERDPDSVRGAFQAYKDLVSRFPSSPYAEDARRRMQVMKEQLAQHELHAARYYLERGAPLAAVNRARALLEKFPLSQQREEALAILIAGYHTLGQTQLRDDARRVLSLNYPESQWLHDNEAQARDNGTWWAFWR